MRTLIMILVIIGGIPVGAIIGQKIMMLFDIPTRLAAAERGRTLAWDITLLGSIAAVITLAIGTVDWVFDGEGRALGMPMPAIVSWLFAAWWLLVGLHDFFLLRYRSDAGPGRYRAPLPLILALSASLALVLLGMSVVTSRPELTTICVVLFGAIWTAWTVIARQARNERPNLNRD